MDMCSVGYRKPCHMGLHQIRAGADPDAVQSPVLLQRTRGGGANNYIVICISRPWRLRIEPV